MLKKFLNDESKSPIKDFLLWLVVYPFVIAFAVACAAFIFSFSMFRDVKITDWVSSLSTMFAMIFTGGLLIVTARAAKSWRKQRIPDAKSSIIENLIIYDGIINHLMIEFNHTDNAIRYEKIVTTYISLFNQISIIESSIIKYYLFDSSCKKQIDHLYLEMKNSLNDFAKQISKYLNSNISGTDISFNPDIISKAVLPFYVTHKLEFGLVLKKSLNASFSLLTEIAGDEIVIKAKENKDNEAKINGSS